jgi:hypothetical protein
MSSSPSRRMIGPLPDIRENDTLWKLRLRGRMCVLAAARTRVRIVVLDLVSFAPRRQDR